jgi:carboxyl-terminal processing protease
VVIVAPLDNSPALRAGLRPGDIILKVSGENVSGLALSEAVERIRGAPGTSVTLTIMTPATGRTQDITLVRQAIRINNVTWLRIPGTTIVHLRIASFSQDAAAHLREALESIRTERFSGVVLDLRNNPGGILDEVVRATGQFLTGGNVLLVKDADGQITPVPVVRGGLLPNLPMVVLVNNGTASAAEIMAGALKDAHRAALVGETTFGTGTVLKQFGLSDGSALLIAIEEWLTPSGQTIWHKGIAPDVIVSLPPDVMPTIPSAERGMTPEELRASGDAQLSRAQQMLSGSPDVKK